MYSSTTRRTGVGSVAAVAGGAPPCQPRPAVASIAHSAKATTVILAGSGPLLRTAEEAHVDRFGEDVPFHRLPHRGARHPRIGAGLHVQLRVERVELERVVMLRPVGRR